MIATNLEAHGLHLDTALRSLVTAPASPPTVTSVIKLRGDASTRGYFRIELAEPFRDHPSMIVMKLPVDAMGSDEGQSSATPTELPFLNMQRALSQRGVPVPEVFAVDMAAGVLLLEDLGEETFFDRLQAQPRDRWHESYAVAIDRLAQMDQAMSEPVDGCIAYGRGFDGALLRWELDHFREWGVEALTGPLEGSVRAALDGCFDRLTASLLELPQGFVHRDYQSRNLMWTPRGAATDLVVIDFQDALQGPCVYDLVALLCDSYVDLDPALQQAMLQRYGERMGMSDSMIVALGRELSLVAVQRKLKDAGRFIYIDRVRHNPDFLQWFPQTLRYVGRALNQCEELSDLNRLLHRIVPGFPDSASVPAPSRAQAR